ASLRFESIFPLQYTLVRSGDEKDNTPLEVRAFNLSSIKDFLVSFFSNVSYIGPMREEPHGEYPIDGRHATVGSKGQFSAEILEKESQDPTCFFEVSDDNTEPLRLRTVDGTLETAVNYWLCERFKIAKSIHAEEDNGIYRIFLESPIGFTTTINHVGFGVSQVLPILIEGLRMPHNGTLLIEEPESHLHPKLQGHLFDFLYS